MINRAYNFACDWCGNAACFLADNEKDAKREARFEDWIMSGAHGCFCSRECYADYKRDEVAKKESERRNEEAWRAFNV